MEQLACIALINITHLFLVLWYHHSWLALVIAYRRTVAWLIPRSTNLLNQHQLFCMQVCILIVARVYAHTPHRVAHERSNGGRGLIICGRGFKLCACALRVLNSHKPLHS